MGLLGNMWKGAKALTGWGEWGQAAKSLDDQMLGGGLDGGSANSALVVLRGTVGDMSRLFVKRRVLLLRQYAEHSEPVRAAIDIYRNCIEQAEWQVVPYDQTRPMNERVRKEIEALLSRVNGFEPYSTVKGKFTEDFLVVGHGSVELGINRDTTPWGLFALDAERVAFVPGWDGTDPRLPRYCELTFDRQVKRWLPDQMCMTLVNRPRSYRPARPLARRAAGHLHPRAPPGERPVPPADDRPHAGRGLRPRRGLHQRAGGRLPPGDSTDQEFLRRHLRREESKFIQFNASERDLKALEKLLFFKRMVAAIFQLPLAVLGELVDASRANTEALLENADKGPGALLWRIKEMENQHIAQKWGPLVEHNCMIDYPIMSRKDEKQQAEISSIQTGKSAWASTNEARRAAGLEAIAGLRVADEVLVPTSAGPIPLSVLNAQFFDGENLREPADSTGDGEENTEEDEPDSSGKRLAAGGRLMLRAGLPLEHVVRKSRHSYATTQLDLPPDVAEEIIAFGEDIPDEDLADGGREARPHVTVLYGLHADSADDLRELLKGVKPITITLGKTALFEGDDFNVVMVRVKGAALKRLHKKVAGACEHTETHPEYVPHATVAYVQPGKGELYAGDDFLSGTKVTIDAVTFSSKTGKRTVIKLDGGADE